MPKSPPAFGFGKAPARGKDLVNFEMVPPGTYTPQNQKIIKDAPLHS